MSIEIVNGYVCRDCGDVALARRDIDPATRGPHRPGAEVDVAAEQARARRASPSDPASGRLVDLVV